MTISQSTTIQAYRLNKGGVRARMAILRMIACDSVNNFNKSTRLQPGDWKAARHWGLESYDRAYGLFSQGCTGWHSHFGEYFRSERECSEGWYTDVDCSETAIGIIGRLSHGRFIAGYRWTSNNERAYFPEVFSDEYDAVNAANEHAHVFAEEARDDSQRFVDMTLAELDVELKTAEVEKAVALRHRAKFGGFDRVRRCIDELRESRETLADAVRAYERA